MDLYPQISLVFTHQGNFSFQQGEETIIENYSKTKGRAAELSVSGYDYKKSPTSKARGTLLKTGWTECKSQRIVDFAVGLYLLVTPEATPVKSYQHDYPTMI